MEFPGQISPSKRGFSACPGTKSIFPLPHKGMPALFITLIRTNKIFRYNLFVIFSIYVRSKSPPGPVASGPPILCSSFRNGHLDFFSRIRRKDPGCITHPRKGSLFQGQDCRWRNDRLYHPSAERIPAAGGIASLCGFQSAAGHFTVLCKRPASWAYPLRWWDGP